SCSRASLTRRSALRHRTIRPPAHLWSSTRSARPLASPGGSVKTPAPAPGSSGAGATRTRTCGSARGALFRLGLVGADPGLARQRARTRRGAAPVDTHVEGAAGSGGARQRDVGRVILEAGGA